MATPVKAAAQPTAPETRPPAVAPAPLNVSFEPQAPQPTPAVHETEEDASDDDLVALDHDPPRRHSFLKPTPPPTPSQVDHGQPETSRPPRPQPPFVQVIETCPTPPSAATTGSHRSRRRPLLLEWQPSLESLQLACEESSTLPREPPSSPPRRDVDALEQQQAQREPPASEGVPQTERQPRRSRRSRPSTDSDSGRPLSELASADLVASLLSQGSAGGPGRPQPASRRVSSEPYRARPISEVEVGRPADSDVPYDEMPHRLPHASLDSSLRQSRLSSATRSSSPSALWLPTPYSTLARHASSPTAQQLRPRPSHATLFSWDLSHLPAPHTPRESPFRVPLRSVFLPTRFLGGGKGTGLYGDPCGAIERKVPHSRVAAAGREERDRSRRRWSWRSLTDTGGEKERLPPRAGPARSCSPIEEDFGGEGDVGGEKASTLSRDQQSVVELGRRPPNRSGSILRRFYRRSWTRGRSEEQESARAEDVKETKAGRRRSLAASFLGEWSRAATPSVEEEDLAQWVSVVMR